MRNSKVDFFKAQLEPLVTSSLNTISRNSVDVETNSTAEGLSLAPYDRLPDSYKNVHPTSYYATHTHVEPIKGYFDHKFIIEEKKRNSDLTLQVSRNSSGETPLALNR